jgi:D-cysteine desulfhydrase/L-cysteate sulfo-lyase
MAGIATAAAGLLGLPHRLTAADIEISQDYIGPGYGEVTPDGREAIDLLAKTEGVLLDPVYTAKAMAALIDDVRHRRVAPGESVVFIHTGGLPAVFAYHEELVPH